MQNLVWKIIFIVLVLLFAGWMLYPPKDNINLGKDLQGGISLVYQLDMPENVEDPEEVVNQVIRVIQDRVNPTGLLDIAFTPVGRDRIEIVMPLPSEEVQALKAAYEEALRDLIAAAHVDPYVLDEALRLGEAPERWGGVGELSERLERLQTLHDRRAELVERYEALQAAPEPDAEAIAEVERELAPLEIEYEELREEILRLSVSETEIRRTLTLPSEGETVENEAGEPIEQPSPREVALEVLKERFPHVADRIDEVVERYDAYAAMRRGFDDPEDLKRLLRGAGVLEFRVAVTVDEAARMDVARLRDQLRERGPEGVDSLTVGWFPLNDLKQWYDTPEQLRALQADPVTYFQSSHGLVAAETLGQYYLLLYTTETRSLTHDRGVEWSVQATRRDTDNLGRPAVGFGLDTPGGRLMRAMTSKNIGKPMAIVLDGQVYSAPRINDAIGADGIITGNFSADELDYLTRVLAAGSLQARLSPEPIAETVIGPSLGADNLEAGLRASVWGIVLVAIFMLLYYFVAGAVADFALLCNALLIFGVMAMQHAAFTLPGIAGIILTIGMAVDANVLIYERIREELFSGENDLRTAVRLGYQKAFSTIIDGNITNLIVCLVLYQTATTEVKGFALTLGIGIVATLFTALFVTRVIYTIYLDVFKGTKLPMLPTVFPSVHRLLEPSVDWFRLRKVLIPLSVVLALSGLVLTMSRGAELYDTEFRGGVSMTFRTGIDEETGERLLLPRPLVEERVHAIGVENPTDPVLAQFANASVRTVGDVEEGFRADTFQVKVALPEEASEDATIQDRAIAALVDAFGEELDIPPSYEFAGRGLRENPTATFPVTEPTLGNVIGRREYTQRVTPFMGGVAIVLDDVEPAITPEEATERIERMRRQPDFAEAASRPFEVVGLEPAEEGGFRSVAVLVRDPNVDFLESQERWEEALAQPEWRLVTAALAETAPLEQVSSFSSAVAHTLFAGAVVAVILSLFGILIYIWVRFGSLRYSLGAILALVHDVSVALGILALTHYVADLPFFAALGIDDFRIDMGVVAAILTLIGYSLNDTIVVLDRIRENRGKRPLASPAIVNTSINQTISRTLLTSSTTLIAVFVMYVFGGTGIRPFAFVLLTGIVVGTYSSIAIAAPLVTRTGSRPTRPAEAEGAEAGAMAPAVS